MAPPLFTGLKFGFVSNGSVNNQESAPTDPYFANRKLLLHMDGSNNSTTFTDSSSSSLSVTARGGAKISTATVKYGTGSGLFDGINTYLELASLLTLSSAYTIEAWIYLARLADNGATMGIITGRGFTNGALLGIIPGTSLLTFSPNYGSGFSVSVPLTLNSWQHVALTRTSSFNYNIWIDGLSRASWTSPNQTPDAWKYIGCRNLLSGSAEVAFAGNMDELRISDRAEYTSNFTPPTGPFPNS